MATQYSTRVKRPIRIEGDVAYVPLTKGYTAIIDAADIHLVDAWNWCVDVRVHTSYAVRGNWNGGKQSLIYMHRLIMSEPDGLHIDHIDGNGLRNMRSNMRISTKSQNGQNQVIGLGNSSGFKGATWHSQRGKWMAQIVLRGERHYLGLHPTAESAHAAYCEASARLHGKFGRTA
jgi:hypothetical protein